MGQSKDIHVKSYKAEYSEDLNMAGINSRIKVQDFFKCSNNLAIIFGSQCEFGNFSRTKEYPLNGIFHMFKNTLLVVRPDRLTVGLFPSPVLFIPPCRNGFPQLVSLIFR